MSLFPKRLKELRDEFKLKQTELAEKLHVHQTYVSKWERGLGEPSYDLLVILADYFGVTTDYLLGRED